MWGVSGERGVQGQGAERRQVWWAGHRRLLMLPPPPPFLPPLPDPQVGYNAEFYSGADLAALLAEAQLAAVHEALAAEDAATAAADAGKPPARHHAAPPIIQRRHLEAALQAARPSVPEPERERLEGIYSGFRQDRQPGGGGGSADKGKGKMVSWA